MKDETQLARWLAGELEGEELKELQTSPRYATLLRIKENFEHIQSPAIDTDTMLTSILAAEKHTPKVIALYRRTWIQVAAVIVVLFGLGWFFTVPEQVGTANGETMAFKLPDNSEVILNAGSQASYTKWNWSTNREVKLDGEAYFKVARGQKFEVQTALGTVTVLGTQFNVRVRNNRLNVVCYEGKVRVQHNGEEVILTPHKAITFDNDKKSALTVTATQPEWLHKELTFEDEALDAVIAELERQYNIHIEAPASKQRFSGLIPSNDLDVALRIISETYHLQAEKSSNKIILTPVNAAP